MKSDGGPNEQSRMYGDGFLHTFVFTHAPIVGHGDVGTHYHSDVDTDKEFVKWVNGEDKNYQEGKYVEAVFAGHTHENHIFYDVSTNPDSDNYMDHPPEYPETSLDLGLPAFYIETSTAMKLYG